MSASGFDPITLARWEQVVGPERWPAVLEHLLERLDRRTTPDPDRLLAELRDKGLVDQGLYRRLLVVRGTPRGSDPDGAADARDGFPVDGRYALLGELGRGGQGEVLVARDLALGRKVAYKLGPSATLGGERHRRFVREAQITAQIDHPNIVPVYELRTSAEGRRAYTMKLVEGYTLHELLAEARGRHEAGEAVDEPRELAGRLEHFLRVCDAIAYAHSRGILHRDLKPDNIMVGPHHEVYVMDWGIARRIHGQDADPDPAAPTDPDAPSGRTRVGVALGTPKYMSPEQARGENDALGPASDQYALGVLLQELVTLRPAVRAKTPELVLLRVSKAQREPMTHAREGVRVPPELEAIVARATALAPGDRYPDVEALAEDVRAHLRGDPVTALPVTAWRRATRWVWRRRGPVVQTGLAVLLIGGALASAIVIAALREAAQSERRELAVTRALATAERRSDEIGSTVSGYGRLAEAIAAAATIVLAHGSPPPGEVLGPADFRGPAAPPDLAASPAYGGAPVSFAEPVFLATGPGDEASTSARQLRLLGDDLRRALVRSATTGSVDLDDAQTRALLGQRGAPVRRIQVVLDDGVRLLYPGTPDTRGVEEVAEAHWYAAAEHRRFLHWTVRSWSEGAVDVVVSRSVFGQGEAGFAGVVAVELLLDRSLLGGAPGDRAWLLDGAGRELLSTPDAGPVAEAVRTGVSSEEPRVLEERPGSICAAVPLSDLGWTYVTCEVAAKG